MVDISNPVNYNSVFENEIVMKLNEVAQDGYKKYKRTNIAEMAPYNQHMNMKDVSVSATDKKNGSPKAGDMIARNPLDHTDKWLVAKKYFEENFEEVEGSK